jgi:hypothetical protein
MSQCFVVGEAIHEYQLFLHGSLDGSLAAFSQNLHVQLDT